MTNLKIKLILSLIAVSFFVISGFTSKHVIETESKVEMTVNSLQYTFNELPTLTCIDNAGLQSVSRECTVRIKTDDMDVEVTLHDVGRWDCFKLKARALWYRIRGKI